MNSGSRSFLGWQIDCFEGKSIWVAILEGEGIWRERSVPAQDAGKALDWRPPFAAKWRADLIRGRGFAESLTFSAPAEGGEKPPALTGDRYVIYPLDRTKATPLTEFTPVDILRNTLGVGPCQYILESEGLATQDNPTPDNVMTWVEKQFRKKGGKDSADEIKERLKAMTEHVDRARARLNAYHDFAASAGALTRVMGTSTEAAKMAEDAAPTFARITKATEEGLAATDPVRLRKSADEVALLIGREDALAQVARPAAEIRAVGAALDHALARSRMAVRWVRVQVDPAALKDKGEAEKATQLQALSDQVLKGK
jgi:hypothetical protein